MRVYSFLALGALAAIMADGQRLTLLSRGGIETRAQQYNAPHTKLSMYIWTDKYTYQAGDALTLKWTVKTNGDLYPYTVFVYRQNNQTGVNTYFPGGATPTDMFGNTADQGFQPVQMADATKQVLIGSGGKFPAVTVPNELGMHTLVVQLRDYSGTRVLKTSYMKIGVIQGTQTLPATISTNMTLTNDTQWNLTGVVFVNNGATLTIQPGTFIMGQSGSAPAVLFISPTGKIFAKGTQARPIVFTSALPFGQRKRGDWAGVILTGKAPVNVLANSHGQTNPAGQFYVEGLPTSPDTLYGGNDPKHNCGTLEYVRIEYAGSILSPNNEVNSFTFAGCGSDTVADHLQAIQGVDDMFEWFGGTMDAKYLVGGLGRDDYTDFQLGFTGRLQYGIMYQSPDYPGNRGIEGDNNEYTPDALPLPFSNPTFYNITYIGTGIPGYDEANSPGIYLRFGTHGSFNNLVVTNFYSPCMQFPDTVTQGEVDKGLLSINGVLCYNNNVGSNGANTLQGQIADGAGANGAYTLAFAQGQKGNGNGKNIMAADPMITRPFEYSDPDFSALFDSPVFRFGWVQPPDDGFFDQSAQFVGGMGTYDWTEEWTCFLLDADIAP